MYAKDEKIEMIRWYLSGSSLRKVRDLFGNKYPERPTPSLATIHKIMAKFNSEGCVVNSHTKRYKTSHIMPDQIKIEERPDPVTNGSTIDTLGVANCCRACKSTERSLVEITSLDYDSIKFSDKLTACIADVVWLKEGLPSLICSNCIERLRVAYDFRNVCLQSDQTFARYISQKQHENKSEELQVESTSPLKIDIKCEFTSTQVISDTLPCIKQEPPNSPQMHFVDINDCFENSKHFIKMDESGNSTPRSEKSVNFIDQKELEPLTDTVDRQLNIEKPESAEMIQTIQLHWQQLIHQQNEPQPQKEVQVQHQPSQDKQVIKGTTSTQVRPCSPEYITSDRVQSKSYTCIVCTKTFQRNNNLKVHMRTHTGENPFECEYCKRRFNHSSHLKEHIKRHTGEKPFQCAVCNKRFTAKSELTIHLKRHLGERPFACTICNHKCLTAANLKIHMRIHTGEKPYSCDICGHKFVIAANLKAHMRTHTREKVNCKICDAKFTNSSQLTVHMREHNGEQPYRCTVCDKVCNYYSQLVTHMTTHKG